MFNAFLIFCFLGSSVDFLGPTGLLLGVELGLGSFLGSTHIDFHFVGFFLLIFYFWVILNHFGSSRAIFGVGVGSEKFLGVYSYRLATFIS